LQQFKATSGANHLEIEVAPWGEGRLKVNGLEIALVEGRKDRRHAFRDLAKIAENYLALDAGNEMGGARRCAERIAKPLRRGL
jgi:enoyl-[acyl-carrier protein] reductase I